MQPNRRSGLARARSLATFVVSVVLAALMFVPAAGAAPITSSKLRVVVDPGHGGSYTGAVSGGVAEKRVNLAIARRVVSQLKARGIDARLTRNGDYRVYRGGTIATWRWDSALGSYRYAAYPANTGAQRLQRDLQARVDVARRQGADLFISIHCNAAGSSARGVEVWRAPNDPLGQQFAADILGGMLRSTGAKNRGVKQANFYVTRWSNMPAVLVEAGFLTNRGERVRLVSASYQDRLAKGIANGVVRFKARPVAEKYERAGGATRYHAAAAVSRSGWPTGTATVVLTSGESFAEPLVAAPLAASLDAPVLTTMRSSLPGPTSAELARLSPAWIVVVGGTPIVSDAVASQAASAAGLPASAVRRVGGTDRYATSLAVARALESSSTSSVVVASGEVWMDALSISASAAERGEPILLTRPSGLDDQTLEFIRSGTQTRTVTVVGGPKTVPNSALRGLAFHRIWGSDRYTTNWQVHKERHTAQQRSRPVLASGTIFTDATVVGPFAAKDGRAVLLYSRSACAQQVRPFVYASRETPLAPMIAGGPDSVSAYVSPSFDKMMMGRY